MPLCCLEHADKSQNSVPVPCPHHEDPQRGLQQLKSTLHEQLKHLLGVMPSCLISVSILSCRLLWTRWDVKVRCLRCRWDVLLFEVANAGDIWMIINERFTHVHGPFGSWYKGPAVTRSFKAFRHVQAHRLCFLREATASH